MTSKIFSYAIKHLLRECCREKKMNIAKVTIKNFRCYSSVDGNAFEWMPNSDLNLLIGPNGSGKTTLIDAIDIILNSEGRSNKSLITEYDFPLCDIQKRIEIEVILTKIGSAISEFPSDIEYFFNDKTGELIEEIEEKQDPSEFSRSIRIKFEAFFDENEGEIAWKWMLPKFSKTDYEEEKELTGKQHEAIGYFRINPEISAGAFTLNQYSALGRHLRKIKYKLGKLPEKLKPGYTPSVCTLSKADCQNCPDRPHCIPGTDDGADELSLGEYFEKFIADAENMLGADSWKNMNSGFGPRYGGMKSSLAAITLGLMPKGNNTEAFIPFERLSSGEKYALSFSLARTRIPNTSAPIIVMEEPETALYPAAIGQMIASLQSQPPNEIPQVIVTTHSESVLRRFSIEHIHVLGKSFQISAITKCTGTDHIRHILECLIMPGSASVLFADKIVVMEGVGEAIVSGELDRLANKIKNEKSFASLGWTVFGASGANETIVDIINFLRNIKKDVAVVLDNDSNGKRLAESTKAICPTFIYDNGNGEDLVLENALLDGLSFENRERAISSFHKIFEECSNCTQKSNINNCINKVGCKVPKKIGKNVIKSHLQKKCLEEYKLRKLFPPAFSNLIKRIDIAHSGEIETLYVKSS